MFIYTLLFHNCCMHNNENMRAKTKIAQFRFDEVPCGFPFALHNTYLNFYVYVAYKWNIERWVKYKTVNMELKNMQLKGKQPHK